MKIMIFTNIWHNIGLGAKFKQNENSKIFAVEFVTKHQKCKFYHNQECNFVAVCCNWYCFSKGLCLSRS